MLNKIKRIIKLKKHQKEWRKHNSHNETTAQSIFPPDRVKVGKGTYGPLNIILMAEDTHIKIGNYVSIGPSVTLMGGGEHDYGRISTYPFQTKIYNEKTTRKLNRDIIIEDDVWIGYEALIMPGVVIGKGSVIGARAIVTKDVPPYSIYVGTKVIKKRFSDEIIEKIKAIDYSEIKHSSGDVYRKYCQTAIDEENIDEVLKNFVMIQAEK